MTRFHRARAAGVRALLPLLLLAVGPLAQAHHTAIDFGLDNSPPSNNTQGEAWEFSNAQCSSATAPATCMIDFNAVTNSGAVDIGFDVNINGAKYSKVFVNKNGIVTFATGLGAFTPATTFTDLTTNVAGPTNPFIAAFYPSSELNIPSSTSPEQLGFQGGAEYGRGTANPAGTDGGTPKDLSHNVAAFKATWAEDESGVIENPIVTRIVFYNTSATGSDGDFDIRIEYGLAAGTVYNGGSGKNGIVGFRLGSDANQVVTSASASTPTAVGSDTDYYYHFCSGSLSATACTAAATPTVTISVLPTSIVLGSSATLNWSSTNATACTASSAWSGARATSGTLQVTPTATGTLSYALACTGAGGTANGSATLTVTSPPPTVTISVSPASIVLGSSATVNWSSTNATGCTASSAWSGAQATSGTLKVTPTAAGTLSYALACTGAGGTANGSAMLTVTSAPPPQRCDVNHDGQIDIRDLFAILDSLGRHVSATDPRDANGNRRVDVFDLLICASRCTHRACEIE